MPLVAICSLDLPCEEWKVEKFNNRCTEHSRCLVASLTAKKYTVAHKLCLINHLCTQNVAQLMNETQFGSIFFKIQGPAFLGFFQI